MTVPTGSKDIFKKLKSSTADVHERVEQRLGIFEPAFDLNAYTGLLERFYGFWKPLEIRLRGVPELKNPALGLERRLKTTLLEADLRVLGLDPVVLPVCSELPEVNSFVRALGSLYVLEGSTLGAQFISKHVKERFNITGESGASFFNAYGPETGKRWSEFRSFVSVYGKDESEDEVVKAALQTFEALDSWLLKYS